MVSESMLFSKLRRRLGSDIFNAFDLDFYRSILNEETLLTFSLYYPRLVRRIRITKNDLIEVRNEKDIQGYYKYKLPIVDEESPYIGIEIFYHPSNDRMGVLTGTSPMLTNMMYGKMASYLPIPDVRFTASFEQPYFIIITPPPTFHNDFIVTMQRVRKLFEIPMYYVDLFTNLFTCDIKMAIYEELKNARDNVVIGGIELNTYINEYNDAVSKREDIIEKMQNDYYKDPERFEAIMRRQ